MGPAGPHVFLAEAPALAEDTGPCWFRHEPFDIRGVRRDAGPVIVTPGNLLPMRYPETGAGKIVRANVLKRLVAGARSHLYRTELLLKNFQRARQST